MAIAPRQPLVHASAWDAATLRDRPEWRHRLEREEQDELLALATAVDGTAEDPRIDGVPLEQLETEARPLPRLSARLRAVQEQLEHGAGVVRLRGFPLASLDPVQVRALYWALAVRVGTPVSQSASGERLLSVQDAGHGRDDPRVRGPYTRKRLSFHTDRCDVVAFLCLQPAREGGDNEVASAMTVHNRILERRPDLVEELMGTFPYKRHTVDPGNRHTYCLQPVFSFCEGHFACCFLRVLIDRAHADPALPDLTPTQLEALDRVEQEAAEPGVHLRFRQESGDLLFVNNWVVLHRRSAFVDHAEPERRRHILRLWLSMPNSRPLDPAFADNYGATAAGAVRGGMQALS